MKPIPDDGWNDVNRSYDEMGPSVPEAVTVLVDALRNYIRAEKQLGEDLLLEGSITRAQLDAGQEYFEPFTRMLEQLERWEIDPSLNGLIRWKWKKT